MRFYIIYVLLAIMSLPLSSQKKWQYIPANHPAIHFTGRFDDSKPKEIRYDWPGTTVQFQFTGNELQLLLSGGERNYFNLFIDNTLHEVLHLPTDTIYNVSDIKGRGSHWVRL
ncbi:hypothetical protein SAMN06265379_1151, partial [Saccharicrinis carchari]